MSTQPKEARSNALFIFAVTYQSSALSVARLGCRGKFLSHIKMLLTLGLFLLVALGIGGDSALKSMIEDCRS